MNQRIQHLKYVFHPESIAFIGATEAMNKWGFHVFNILLQGGWKGNIYPVNPGRDEVLGIKAYPSVSDIPGNIDLAVFTIPARFVSKTIDECILKGTKAALIITAGFKEKGGDSVYLEEKIVEKARAGNMLIIGPNCEGVICPEERFFSWMASFYMRPGKVAIASQSGNILNMLIEGVVSSGLGVAKGVSSGNEADIKMEDYFEYFTDDPCVDVMVGYMEGLQNPRRFIKKIRNIPHKKPVILIKGGRSHFGAMAAASHTGAMAVPDTLFKGMCRQYGVILSDTPAEAGYLAASFVNRPLPKGKRVAIITGGGGLGVLASDRIAQEGLTLARFSQDTMNRIAKNLPDYWVPGNPVDMVAGLDFLAILPIAEVILESGEADVLILSFISPPQTSPDALPEPDARGVTLPGFSDQMLENVHLISEFLIKLSFKYDVPIFPIMNQKDSKGVLLSERQGENAISWSQNIDVTIQSISKMHQFYLYKQKMEISALPESVAVYN